MSELKKGTCVSTLKDSKLEFENSKAICRASQKRNSGTGGDFEEQKMAKEIVPTLLIDDDKNTEQSLSLMLKSAPCYDFVISHAVNFETACAKSANGEIGNPELVILDLTIPGGLSGIPLAREVREVYPDSLVIVHTDAIDDATKKAISEIGVQDCIVKGTLSKAQTLERIRSGVTRFRAFKETHVLREIVDKGERVIRACEDNADLPPYDLQAAATR